MTFEDWVQSVPAEITGDALWQMNLYRQALFLGELAWFDVCKLAQTHQTRELRESRDWYYKGRHVLGEKVVNHRLKVIVHILRQLLKLVPEYCTRQIREEIAQYEIFSVDDLLSDVPMSY